MCYELGDEAGYERRGDVGGARRILSRAGSGPSGGGFVFGLELAEAGVHERRDLILHRLLKLGVVVVLVGWWVPTTDP